MSGRSHRSLDILRLQNLVFYGYHGDDKRERELGQQYAVDLWLFFDMSKPAKTDRVADTVNYVAVYNTVRDIVVNNTFKLVERIAGTIADACLEQYPVAGVEVRVRKPRPPIPAALDYLEIRIRRGETCDYAE